MDLNRYALQTAPEKRCFPFLTMVYSACSMETGTGTLLFAIVWMTPIKLILKWHLDMGSFILNSFLSTILLCG